MKKENKNKTTSAIETFLSRYHTAMKARSKEMRFDISFVAELASSISLLQGRNSELYEELISTQKELIEFQKQNQNVNSTGTEISAGGFKN